MLRKVFPKDVQIIDGSCGVANRLKDILENKEEIGNQQLEITYYYSGKKVENASELNKMKRLLSIIK